jgi:hypothetical protein
MCEDKKVCTKCWIEKPLSEFYLVAKGQGYRGDCKECNLKRKKLSRESNPEKERERARNYRLNNPNKFKEWYDRNTEHVLLKCKNWKILINTKNIKKRIRKKD